MSLVHVCVCVYVCVRERDDRARRRTEWRGRGGSALIWNWWAKQAVLSNRWTSCMSPERVSQNYRTHTHTHIHTHTHTPVTWRCAFSWQHSGFSVAKTGRTDCMHPTVPNRCIFLGGSHLPQQTRLFKHPPLQGRECSLPNFIQACAVYHPCSWERLPPGRPWPRRPEHSEHRFPAPSSKLCQIWLPHWRGSLYLRAAVHRRGQRPPTGSDTDMTVEAT